MGKGMGMGKGRTHIYSPTEGLVENLILFETDHKQKVRGEYLIFSLFDFYTKIKQIFKNLFKFLKICFKLHQYRNDIINFSNPGFIVISFRP